MTDIHPVFMVSSSKASDAKVPESCIESAEYIIQAYAPNNRALKWKQGAEVEPHVWMHFGAGNSYNISTQEDVHDLVDAANTDFNFDTRPPKLGEGVAFINIGPDNQPNGYNMHFMAVLVREGTASRTTGCVVSNLNELGGQRVKEVSLNDPENMKRLSGGNPWKAEKEKYQKDNGGEFRMALLSASPTRPIL